MPFVGVLLLGLGLVSYVPWFSTVAIRPDIAAARAKAKKDNLPPRDAWMMECVQEDPNNPQPCSAEDRQTFPGGQMPVAPVPGAGSTDENAPAPDIGCNPDFEDCSDAGKK